MYKVLFYCPCNSLSKNLSNDIGFINIGSLVIVIFKINFLFTFECFIRGFSRLSAPPVNRGVPKGNGPVPNEM